jgi:hypothetical protein
VLGVAKGRIGSDGTVVLEPKLNRIGRKLLAKAPGGMLQAQAEATIKEPRQRNVRARLLPQLVELVRGS